MKLSTAKSNPKKSALMRRIASGLLIFLWATVVLADEIDDSLPRGTSPKVKAGARQVIESGLGRQVVVKLTAAMLQNKFDEQQIQLGFSLLIQAKSRNLPVRPIISKAFEGMAKGVDPSLIVAAMEKVYSRNVFAYLSAARISESQSRAAALVRPLADALAAGLSMEPSP